MDQKAPNIVSFLSFLASSSLDLLLKLGNNNLHCGAQEVEFGLDVMLTGNGLGGRVGITL